jgi:sialic acid synthase SpsE
MKKKLKIYNKVVDFDSSTFIIAEISGNHNEILIMQ